MSRTRLQAVAQGHKRYSTGVPCRHGHIAERSVSEGKCYECTRLRNREYRAANPKKFKRLHRAHREKFPEKYRQYAINRAARGTASGYTKKWRANLSKDPHSPENAIKVARHMLSGPRKRARDHGLGFSLTPEDILPLPEHCPVFGCELIYFAPLTAGSKLQNRASIDRIDNTKGYVPGNVKIISWRANHIKTDATTKEVEAVLRYMKESGV